MGRGISWLQSEVHSFSQVTKVSHAYAACQTDSTARRAIHARILTQLLHILLIADLIQQKYIWTFDFQL